MGTAGCKAILAAYDRALADGVPVVGLWHSGGARLREGVASLHAVGEVFAIMTRASGKVPQISVVLGPAAGGAAYGPALTDIVILGPEGRVFVTGPDVVRSVTGEDVDMLRLGGPEPHGRRSGVVHVVTDSEDEALDEARGSRRCSATRATLDAPPTTSTSPACCPSRPARLRRAPARRRHLLDEGTRSSCTRSGRPTSSRRSAGSAAAPSASSPTTRCASAAASTRPRRRRPRGSCACATRSACRWSSLVDVPGYLPGVGQEWDGVVRRGAKLLHAFAEAVVPRVTVVTRKAYGGAYIAMNSRSLGATRVFAWPDAEVAVMGAVAAVRILHRRRLAEAPADVRGEVETELADEHEQLAGGLARAHQIGVVDEVIAADPDPVGDRRGHRRRPRRPRPARQHPAVAAHRRPDPAPESTT